MKKTEYLNKIIQGDTLAILKTLPDEIVDMGVTSPPYNKGENKTNQIDKSSQETKHIAFISVESKNEKDNDIQRR